MPHLIGPDFIAIQAHDLDAMHEHLIEKICRLPLRPRLAPLVNTSPSAIHSATRSLRIQSRKVKRMATYWMGVARADHACAGRDGGFAQLGHGKHEAVKSLKRGDWIVYYSPKEKMGEGDAVKSFTTIGQVTSDEPYQVTQAIGFEPFRVDVDYVQEARPAPIAPLLEKLALTKGRGSNWGIVMRRSKSKLSPDDVRIIAAAMEVADEKIEGL